MEWVKRQKEIASEIREWVENKDVEVQQQEKYGKIQSSRWDR